MCLDIQMCVCVRRAIQYFVHIKTMQSVTVKTVMRSTCFGAWFGVIVKKTLTGRCQSINVDMNHYARQPSFHWFYFHLLCNYYGDGLLSEYLSVVVGLGVCTIIYETLYAYDAYDIAWLLLISPSAWIMPKIHNETWTHLNRKID